MSIELYLTFNKNVKIEETYNIVTMVKEILLITYLWRIIEGNAISNNFTELSKCNFQSFMLAKFL